jgi:hypothetical protein
MLAFIILAKAAYTAMRYCIVMEAGSDVEHVLDNVISSSGEQGIGP